MAGRSGGGAGGPDGVPATTVNKMCGSGMESITLGHDMIKAGSAGIVVAGGLESMSNAPYMLPKARSGMRMGHGHVLDHMFTDGLQSPYDQQMMGVFGETCAEKYGFSRTDQDAFAHVSVERAQRAEQRARFEADLVRRRERGQAEVPVDEHLLAALAEGLPDCAGVSVGIDRLLMAVCGEADIAAVQSFCDARA